MREFMAVVAVSLLAGVAFGIARPIHAPEQPIRNNEITALRQERGS